MWKAVIAGAAAFAIAGVALAHAQQDQKSPGAQRGRLSVEDVRAFTDARIAALKAGLKLTPDQDKNWAPVEAAIRDLARQRVERMQERRERIKQRRDGAAPRDGIAMLRQRADRMQQRATGLKTLADAAEPLYKTLDESQKRRLHVLAWSLRAHDPGARRARAEAPL